MASDGIVEPIDVAANGPVGFLAGDHQRVTFTDEIEERGQLRAAFPCRAGHLLRADAVLNRSANLIEARSVRHCRRSGQGSGTR